ncbi:MAG: T9SS type A sorting domain-containing protein, partial [Candidatus Neomarinimicrobiota bacterium]|nr:T9SS type A sorting domain-containing protein [Candidatus Neomarinimicrobiota bacterium]
LLPAFPNPFNPITTIPFHISNDQVIDLAIYDINGRKIHSLLRNAEMEIGQHQIRWNAGEFGSGLYFVQLKNNENVLIKKIMLLK